MADEPVLDVAAWVARYAHTRRDKDADAVAELVADDASYRANPFNPAHCGRDGVRAYWHQATATQAELALRFGEPVVAGRRAAVE